MAENAPTGRGNGLYPRYLVLTEVLLHCGKAVNRAGLWKESAKLDRDTLPTVGHVMASLARLADVPTEVDAAQIEKINVHYDHAVRHDLY